jgi:hypothetical protein
MRTTLINFRSRVPFFLTIALVSGCSQLSDSRRVATPGDAALFDELKTLQGRWESPAADKDGKPEAVVYRVTSAGSAVEETLFPGTAHEMVTLYNLDHGRLTATHYCALGNQPRMQAAPGSTMNKMVFHFVDGMNLDPQKDKYMGALTLTIPDGEHLKQEWISFEAGTAEAPHIFEYTRVKA